VIGIDADAQAIRNLERSWRLNLHARAGKINAYSGNDLSGVDQADIGINAHPDVIPFLLVVPIGSAHVLSFTLVAEVRVLITPGDLGCKDANRAGTYA
jgi:hypothetical protein